MTHEESPAFLYIFNYCVDPDSIGMVFWIQIRIPIHQVAKYGSKLNQDPEHCLKLNSELECRIRVDQELDPHLMNVDPKNCIDHSETVIF